MAGTAQAKQTEGAEIMQFPEKSRYKPETGVELMAAQAGFIAEADAAPDWLAKMRQAGAKEFARQGLPTPKLERWKYTNIQPLLKGLDGKMPLVSGGLRANDTVDKHVQNLGQVIANGVPDWLSEVMTKKPTAVDQYRDFALWDLAAAFTNDGIVIDVPAGMIVDKPVEISMDMAGDTIAMPRIIIRLGQGAELTVIETASGNGSYWRNALTQIEIGDNAKLRHYRLQDDSREALYTQTTFAHIGRDAVYEAFTLTSGAAMSRNQIQADLCDENSACNVYGLNLLSGSQIGDTTITIDHKAPHCASDQFYRTVLDDQVRGVFQGKVHVHQIAQKTDGYQLSNALLLSDTAEMDTKPELEIYADDVKCSHGATTGQLDDEPLFYLRSRGLTEKAAKALLIEAFLAEVIERVTDESFAVQASEITTKWLHNAIR